MWLTSRLNFAPGGWKAPTPELTELFQVRTDVFRPVTLPGEIKSRSSKQCVGFSSGFVYTVRDRSRLSPSHQQHDPRASAALSALLLPGLKDKLSLCACLDRASLAKNLVSISAGFSKVPTFPISSSLFSTAS